MAVMAVMLNSCSSDDEDNSSTNLAGTTWIAGEGTEEVVTLIFQSKTFSMSAMYDYNLDGKIDETTDSFSGEYYVDGNNVVMSRGDAKEYGTISDNGKKMAFISEDVDLVFYKQ